MRYRHRALAFLGALLLGASGLTSSAVAASSGAATPASSPATSSPAASSSAATSSPSAAPGSTAATSSTASNARESAAAVSPSPALAAPGRGSTLEGRIWITVQSDDRKANQVVRAQMPYEWLQNPEVFFSAELQAEIRKQKVDLKSMAQLLRTRPVGEKLEVLRSRGADEEVRIVLEHRGPPAGQTLATNLQLQVREDRPDGTRIDATLPIELARLLIPMLSEVDIQGERPLAEVEQIVDLDRLMDGLGRYEPFELVAIEEPGSKVNIRSR